MSESPDVPAGWYPDENMASTQRYWNGQAWTDDTAPLPTARKRRERARSEWIGWVIFAVVALFFVAMAIGIVQALIS